MAETNFKTLRDPDLIRYAAEHYTKIAASTKPAQRRTPTGSTLP
ncbi:hypothetical protein [Rhodopseudomonas palustris]|nr:hypothetical protein [Rhodopseudomonas palustris]